MEAEAKKQYLELRNKLANYLSMSALKRVDEAFYFAIHAHGKQYRLSKELYISHPIAVCSILADFKMDESVIKAAILHDVLEDTSITKQHIEDKFGFEISLLVEGVTKLTKINFSNYAERQAANFRKMILAMTKDIRIILIKVADRLHNMQTLEYLSLESRKRVAKETLEIYAPIAHRLGINDIRIKFEDLAFEALYPLRYRVLKSSLHKARGNRKEIMGKIISSIKEYTKQSNVLIFDIYGREKHLYGLYNKMKLKSAVFNDIMDVYAVRIIVETVDDCYRVLGFVHNLYKPIIGRFKDYIAIPKANGYQSLHTTLFGPFGVSVEIQIRTTKMEEHVNHGIAAHWLYKQGDSAVTDVDNKLQGWIKSLLELQQSSGNSLEFLENVKIDLFPDEEYVFTPSGDIMKLPTGATVIDFAHAVHSDLGNSCIGAKVDRKSVPLSTVIKSGQMIEIISLESSKPKLSWLNFVTTSKAQSNIRNFLKSQGVRESITLGRRLLHKAINNLGCSCKDINILVVELTNKLDIEVNQLFSQIGQGRRNAILTARQLSQYGTLELINNNPLLISGTEGMNINMAKCCRPIPGDAIIAYSAGIKHTLVVHRDNCRNIAEHFNIYPDKFVEVQWEKDLDGEYSALLKLDLLYQHGALAKLANVIANNGSNISSINTETDDGKFSSIKLIILVKDRHHLAQILKKMHNLKSVYHLHRPR